MTPREEAAAIIGSEVRKCVEGWHASSDGGHFALKELAERIEQALTARDEALRVLRNELRRQAQSHASILAMLDAGVDSITPQGWNAIKAQCRGRVDAANATINSNPLAADMMRDIAKEAR